MNPVVFPSDKGTFQVPKEEDVSRLAQRAINLEGFIFDPMSGDYFSVNTTGLLIPKPLQEQKAVVTIVREIQARFSEVAQVIGKDILDFKAQLRIYRLLP
jgi:hypothetical protein